MLDVTFGSTHFIDAIDRAWEAKRMHHVPANVKPNWPEAKRLYTVAIADANLAIKELCSEETPRRSMIDHMLKLISEWEGEMYSMP